MEIRVMEKSEIQLATLAFVCRLKNLNLFRQEGKIVMIFEAK